MHQLYFCKMPIRSSPYNSASENLLLVDSTSIRCLINSVSLQEFIDFKFFSRLVAASRYCLVALSFLSTSSCPCTRRPLSVSVRDQTRVEIQARGVASHSPTRLVSVLSNPEVVVIKYCSSKLSTTYVCLSVCPRPIGIQTTKAVTLNLEFAMLHIYVNFLILNKQYWDLYVISRQIRRLKY